MLSLVKYSRSGKLFLAIFLMGISANIYADQFHYNNIIIGDRALGLGGAFGGVADDASGVYYNPAGLGFALSNDISGSANAFYTKKYTYKNTIGNSDYVEKSSGSLPSFFGFLQKMDKVAQGLVWGLGVYATDSELRDQNDVIENTLNINRLHRAQNMRASTFHYSTGVGYRLTSTFSVGFGLSYFAVDELFQDYQDIQQTFTNDTTVGTATCTASCTLLRTQGSREYLVAKGIDTIFGVQWAPISQLSLGLTLKVGKFISQSYENLIEVRDHYLGGQGDSILSPALVDLEYSNPLGSPPLRARLGTSWFASPELLITFDTMYVGEAKSGEFSRYKRESVINFATGMEYYILSSLPIRLGLFTNNDSRPQVEEGKVNQADHIDFVGGTIFFAWVQPNSQVSLGLISQNGSGKAQKIGNSIKTQDIEVTSQTVAFSASHNF